MSKKIVVITGGAGFIGSHMVDLCVDHGYSVRVIDNLASGRLSNLRQHASNPQVTVDELDIRALSPNASAFSDAHYVFHFAGIADLVPSIERPVDYMSVNTQGTVQVLECCRHASTIRRMVYAASSSCYGLASVPTSEGHPIQVEHPYGLSKYLGELTAFNWHRIYGVPVNSV